MSGAEAHAYDADMRRANRKKAVAGRSVVFKIKRCDGPGKPSRWEAFRVPVEQGANVISSLKLIAANPVTTDGTKTTPVVWDSNCLEEVCGACTMVINGRVRQSCSCLIDEYAPLEGDEMTLEPMSKFPVVRDLWVDRARMFKNLERIRGWVPIDGTYSLGPGPKESHDHQQLRYALSECMTCGCCLDACPQFHKVEDEQKWDSSFVGAQIFSQVQYFNEHPTGKDLKPERMDVMAMRGGIDDCGNAQNCVKVCPKGIPLTEAIGAVGRSATMHAIKQFFWGR